MTEGRHNRLAAADNPYELASQFAKCFGEAEYAMKRSGLIRRNKAVAEADWDALAAELGSDFFDFVVRAGIANTLIGDPPRRLMSDLRWAPERPDPLNCLQELMVQGVCRVRNSYLHGEKFRGGPDGQWERDATLVREAHAVLEEAMAWWVRSR